MFKVSFGRPRSPTMTFTGSERTPAATANSPGKGRSVRTATTVEMECQTDPILIAEAAPPPYVNDAQPPPSYPEVV